jgi:hypothetical protein
MLGSGPLVLCVVLLLGLAVFLQRPALHRASSAGARAHAGAGASEEGGPAVLVLSTRSLDLGELEPGRETTAVVDWRVRGRGALRVLALRPDCRCADVDGLPAALEGGQSGRLRVRLKVPRRGGALRARVRIVTNGPPGADVFTLVLLGAVLGDWQFDPSALDLGRWPPGRVASRTVAFSGPPAVVAGLIEAGGALRHLEPRVEGFEAHVQVLPPAQAHPGAHARLRLDVRIPQAAGLHQGYLLVHVPEGEARLLPIRCIVVPGGKASPPESEQTQNAHDVPTRDALPSKARAGPVRRPQR